MYLKFAWRYFKAKKSTHAINIISWVTLGVIAFSTMCQVLVLSVFNGFEGLVRSLYSNFYADLKVLPAKGKTITVTAGQLKKITALPGVKGVSEIAEEKALLKNGDQQSIVFLKGVDSNYRNLSGVPKSMYRGSFDIGTMDNPKLVLGVGIESALGVEAEKNLFPVTVFLPKKTSQSNPLAALSEGNAATAGSFAIQQEFDNKYAITNIDFVKQQMNYTPDEFSALEVSLVNPNEYDHFVKEIRDVLGNSYKVVTKYQQNASLYRSMRLEKWIIYAILTLILIIAAFNMIGALTMLVLEKQKDINVLQSLGADNSLIKKIFLSEGMLLAIAGAATGILMAVIICILQLKFKIIRLAGTSFLIDYFPVKMQVTDFLLVAFTSFVIAFTASWFPASKASRQAFSLKT
ncbi:MAG TPA: FtsX-like permease family protein [Chitinophagaceae bacterium]|nr:FtsX-like permease family protein [Chitinophagaceae bacterium]